MKNIDAMVGINKSNSLRYFIFDHKSSMHISWLRYYEQVHFRIHSISEKRIDSKSSSIDAMFVILKISSKIYLSYLLDLLLRLYKKSFIHTRRIILDREDRVRHGNKRVYVSGIKRY